MEEGRGGSGGGFLDWDWDTVAEDELQAIEAAYTSSSSSTKRRGSPDLGAGDADSLGTRRRRRLPRWAGIDATPSVLHVPARKIAASRSDNGSPASSPSNAAWGSTPLRQTGKVKVRYPTIVFSGCIRYCRTVPEVEQACMEILDKIRSLKQNKDRISLGFDIEWRPNFKRGEAQRKVAVMQLCLENVTCYVMHIFHTGIPPVLKSVLENDVFIKVGIAISNDAWKVQKDYNVFVEPLEDLSSLANLKLRGAPKRWSLGSLTEMIICKELPKPKKIRLGNWEADLLSKEQLQYAATDAFLSWYLHQVLKGYPNAKSEAGNMEDAEMNEHP